MCCVSPDLEKEERVVDAMMFREALPGCLLTAALRPFLFLLRLLGEVLVQTVHQLHLVFAAGPVVVLERL